MPAAMVGKSHTTMKLSTRLTPTCHRQSTSGPAACAGQAQTATACNRSGQSSFLNKHLVALFVVFAISSTGGAAKDRRSHTAELRLQHGGGRRNTNVCTQHVHIMSSRPGYRQCGTRLHGKARDELDQRGCEANGGLSVPAQHSLQHCAQVRRALRRPRRRPLRPTRSLGSAQAHSTINCITPECCSWQL